MDSHILKRLKPGFHIPCSRPELEKCYHFTQLAVELNEHEEGVAKTDSRLRPDQKLMEEGNWEEANKIKVLVEEKQRAARRKREAEAAEAAAEGGYLDKSPDKSSINA